MRNTAHIASLLALLLAACDAPMPDDAGLPDAEASDGGALDSGALDSGALDSGPTDGGAMDAAPNDGGPVGFQLGGTVSGLRRAVVLELNGDETLFIEADGAFVFSSPVTNYEVVMTGQAEEDFCTFTSETGGSLTADGLGALSLECVVGTMRSVERFEYADGEVTSARRETHSEVDDTFVELSLESNGPGADGVLFNDDDPGFSGSYGVRDPNFRRLLSTSIVALGPDAAPATLDDVLEEYSMFEYDAEGGLLLSAYYEDPGADGLWRNADDPLADYSARRLITRDAMARPTCEAEWLPGPDGLLDTADDLEDSSEASTYTADAVLGGIRQDRREAQDSFGADGLPCTPDDPERFTRRFWRNAAGRVFLEEPGNGSLYTERRYDSGGDQTHQVSWSKGTDALLDGPGRGDDVVINYQRFVEDGTAEFSGRFDDPGTDGVFFTGDDLLASGETYEIFDAEGRQVQLYDYERDTAPAGADELLGTPDDVARRYIHSTWVAGGRRCAVQATAPGPNGTWDAMDCGNASRAGGALDDAIEFVSWTSFDADGLPLRAGRSSAPGPDGQWATDDDILELEASEYVRPDAQTSIRLFHTDYGADGLPFTTDDVIGYAFVTQTDARGDNVYSAEIGDAGPDGQFFTGDDDNLTPVRRERGPAGAELRRIQYDGPGADGLWFTGDDVVSRDERFEHSRS